MLQMRGDIGMLFQETALFDSLTVADNVGYRLLEEMGMPYEEVRRRSQEVLGFHRPRGLHGSDAVGAVRRAAPPRRHRAGLRLEAAASAHRRSDVGPRSHHVEDGRQRDHQVQGPRACHLHRGDASAARCVLHRGAPGRHGQRHVSIVPRMPAKADEAEFIMLADTKIYFEGNFAALRASTDPYLKKFLSD